MTLEIKDENLDAVRNAIDKQIYDYKHQLGDLCKEEPDNIDMNKVTFIVNNTNALSELSILIARKISGLDVEL